MMRKSVAFMHDFVHFLSRCSFLVCALLDVICSASHNENWKGGKNSFSSLVSDIGNWIAYIRSFPH